MAPGVKKKAAARKTPARKTPAKKAAPKRHGSRADLGAPVDAFFAKQPPHLRPIADALRAMIANAAPGAAASLKWGMPFYALGDAMVCAIGAHKSHVNLILTGPPGTYSDPERHLTGEGKTGRHLKLTSLDDLPRAAVRGWLATAVKRARG